MTTTDTARDRLAKWNAELAPSRGAYVPFPIDTLPRVMRGYVDLAAARMDVDPVFIILPGLSMFAAAVGNAVRVIVRSGWREPCAIWTGIVALPGSMKTDTQKVALAPIDLAKSDARLANGKAKAQYDAAKLRYKVLLREWEKSGDTSTDPPAEPVQPPRQQWTTSNITPESLAQVLSENPRGVLIPHDELAGFFAFNQYKTGANSAEPGAAIHISCYSGAPYEENRKGNGGTHVQIESVLTSVTGGIQPQTLGRVLGRQYIEDGLASRFWWVQPPDKPGGFIAERPDEPDLPTDYAEAHRLLRSIPLNIDQEGKLHQIIVPLCPEAQAIGMEWVNTKLLPRMKLEPDPAIRAALAKIKGGVFRVALVFHLLDWAADGGDHTHHGSIDAETMRRAIRVAEWVAHEQGRVYRALAGAGDDDSAADLAYIRSKGGAITANDLAHGRRRYRKEDDPGEAAEKALDALVERGLGEWGPWSDNGRSRRFRVFSDPERYSAGTEPPANHGKSMSTSATPDGLKNGEPGEPDWG